MKKRLLLILAPVILLSSCVGKVDPEFLQNEDFCLRIKDNVVFRYDERTCQTAFNRRRAEFRVHTDNMSDYYRITLSGVPTGEGQKFTGDVTWTSTSNIFTKKGCTFTVSKMDAEHRVWLWCRKEQMGAVVQILD